MECPRAVRYVGTMPTLFRTGFVVLALASGLAADTYPRQASIRPEHYQFRVTLRDDSNEISGETTLRVQVLRHGPQQSFWLDLADSMVVGEISSRGKPVGFRHSGGRLEMDLPATEGLAEFTVRYHGIPRSGLFIGKNRHGNRAFFSVNWPDNARQWLPVVDHPSAKATSEFWVTAPAHYQVVSNGLLSDQTDLPDGMRLTHWVQSIPIAPWLNALGVAEFASKTFGAAAGVPLQSWVFREDKVPAAPALESPMRRAVSYFAEYVGPYPYEKLAGVQALGFGGGMELASSIFYGEQNLLVQSVDSLVAHEVAHQWFGDSVTEKDWDDVWLSEGFATYFALLYREHYEGRDGFADGLRRSREVVLDLEPKLPGAAVRHGNLSDMSKVLNRIVYEKGAWVLHMLRIRLGDEVFRTGIREYYRRYRDSNASTAELRQVMEQASGQDLGWFFEQWLNRAGSPKVSGRWRFDSAKGTVEIDLAQTQPGPAYRLDFDFAPASGVGHAEMTEKRQHFSVKVAKDPGKLELDPLLRVLAGLGEFTRSN